MISKILKFRINIFKFGWPVQKLCYFCVIKYLLANEYSFAEVIVLPLRFCIISTFDIQKQLRRVIIILFGYFGGDILAQTHPFNRIIEIFFFRKSLFHSYKT